LTVARAGVCASPSVLGAFAGRGGDVVAPGRGAHELLVRDLPREVRGKGAIVNALLRFSRAVDAVNERFGWIANWLVLLACLISAGNASSRYAFSMSSNAWLEIQWYMFSGMFLLGASYTLKVNEHVRVDLVYANVTDRTRLWIDLLGMIFFLLPATILLAWMTWPFFYESWVRDEMSGNAGGLIRWPVKLLLPIGFTLLTFQGLSEVIKRIAALKGVIRLETKYEAPQQ
jgi:TRAP-type mannitol/chloroaromatic compound transport system permease small subunit